MKSLPLYLHCIKKDNNTHSLSKSAMEKDKLGSARVWMGVFFFLIRMAGKSPLIIYLSRDLNEKRVGGSHANIWRKGSIGRGNSHYHHSPSFLPRLSKKSQ